MRRLSDFLQRRGKCIDGAIDLLLADNQWRLEADDVAIHSAYTDQHTLAQKAVTNRIRFRCSRRQLFVFDQFDTDHQPQAANLADERIVLLQVAQLRHGVFTGPVARAGRSSCSMNSIFASEAAHETGLPPNVER